MLDQRPFCLMLNVHDGRIVKNAIEPFVFCHLRFTRVHDGQCLIQSAGGLSSLCSSRIQNTVWETVSSLVHSIHQKAILEHGDSSSKFYKTTAATEIHTPISKNIFIRL